MDSGFDVTGIDQPRHRLIGVYVRQQNQEPCSEEWRAQRALGWPADKCREKALEYRRTLNGGPLPASVNAIAAAIHWAFDYFAQAHKAKTIDELRAEIRQKMAGFGAT